MLEYYTLKHKKYLRKQPKKDRGVLDNFVELREYIIQFIKSRTRKRLQ
jgi:hypothetical protein